MIDPKEIRTQTMLVTLQNNTNDVGQPPTKFALMLGITLEGYKAQ